MRNLQTNRGFTLIELLVVIAIIGMLSSVVLASLNSARKKSRDARRASDLKQIQTALELYFDSQNPVKYPTSIAAMVTGGQLPTEPKDPKTGNSYLYYKGNATYQLGAVMEGSTIASPNPTADCPNISGENYCITP